MHTCGAFQSRPAHCGCGLFDVIQNSAVYLKEVFDTLFLNQLINSEEDANKIEVAVTVFGGR